MRAILVANTQKHYNATISYASLTTDSEPSEKSFYILAYCKVACHSVGIYIGEFDKIKIDEGLLMIPYDFRRVEILKTPLLTPTLLKVLLLLARFFHKLRDMMFITSSDD